MKPALLVALFLTAATASARPPVRTLCAPVSEKRAATPAASLRSCICALTGPEACARLPHYVLGHDDAALVKRVTIAATHKETWDRHELFNLEYQPRLIRATAALAFDETSSRKGAPRALLATAAAACAQVLAVVSREPFDAARARDALTCVFRQGGELWQHSVWDRWPGSRCHDGHGVRSGHSCLYAYTEEDFQDSPIDTRLPRAVARFIRRLETRLPGLTLTEAGINGCTILRLETTARVKALGEGSELKLDHVSNHSRATACDLRFLVFSQGAGKPELRFDMAPKGGAGGVFPLATALDKVVSLKPQRDGSQIATVYRELEAAIRAHPDGKRPGCEPRFATLTDDEWLALRIGVLAHNALTGAGFSVVEPLANSSHFSHLHFEIP